jgi:RNA polymerase sigma-70 factor (ECF subfamily)
MTIGARSQPWVAAGRRTQAEDGDHPADLSARLHGGDLTALGDLAEAWGPRLYSYLVRLTADPELARDLVQDTLVRALKALLGGARPDDLRAWLLRIATNLARDDRKSAYRQRVALYDALDPPEGAAFEPSAERCALDAALVAGREKAVQRALRTLAPELREVIVLRFGEDLPVRTIAAVVGIPEGTVKSRLYRAYRALEESLADWWATGEEGDGRA